MANDENGEHIFTDGVSIEDIKRIVIYKRNESETIKKTSNFS